MQLPNPFPLWMREMGLKGPEEDDPIISPSGAARRRERRIQQRALSRRARRARRNQVRKYREAFRSGGIVVPRETVKSRRAKVRHDRDILAAMLRIGQS